MLPQSVILQKYKKLNTFMSLGFLMDEDASSSEEIRRIIMGSFCHIAHIFALHSVLRYAVNVV